MGSKRIWEPNTDFFSILVTYGQRWLMGLIQKKTWGKFGLRPSYSGYISFAIATRGFKSEHLPRWKTNENREKNLSSNSPWYHRQVQNATADWVGWGIGGDKKIKTDRQWCKERIRIREWEMEKEGSKKQRGGKKFTMMTRKCKERLRIYFQKDSHWSFLIDLQ